MPWVIADKIVCGLKKKLPCGQFTTASLGKLASQYPRKSVHAPKWSSIIYRYGRVQRFSSTRERIEPDLKRASSDSVGVVYVLRLRYNTSTIGFTLYSLRKDAEFQNKLAIRSRHFTVSRAIPWHSPFDNTSCPKRAELFIHSDHGEEPLDDDEDDEDTVRN